MDERSILVLMVSTIAFIAFLISAAWFLKAAKKMRQNGEIEKHYTGQTEAMLIRFNNCKPKEGYGFEPVYRFTVDGKTYERSIGHIMVEAMDLDNYEIGSTLSIAYDENNPEDTFTYGSDYSLKEAGSYRSLSIVFTLLAMVMLASMIINYFYL